MKLREPLAVILAALLTVGCGLLPGPTPPEPPPPCTPGSCDRNPNDPRACNEESGKCEPCVPDLSGAIWNTDAGEVWCSTAERPVKHWPPAEECPVLTQPCEDVQLPTPQCSSLPPGSCACFELQDWKPCTPPEPQCPTFTDRGGTEQCQADACDCYCGLEWRECQTEPPPDNKWSTPTAAQMQELGLRVQIRPKREGRRGIGVTPVAEFGKYEVDGKPYYCQPGLWPEACAEGRLMGPPAPDGHPDRIATEQIFYEQPCATVSVEPAAGGHMSLDPWIVQGGVNQNHPRNVEACGQARFQDDPSWVKEPYQGRLYIVEGQLSWATWHGTGQVCAEAKGGVGKHCISVEER